MYLNGTHLMINPWSPNTYFLLLPTPQRRSIYLFFLYFLTFSQYSIPDTKNTKRYPCNAQSGVLHTSPDFSLSKQTCVGRCCCCLQTRPVKSWLTCTWLIVLCASVAG